MGLTPPTDFESAPFGRSGIPPAAQSISAVTDLDPIRLQNLEKSAGAFDAGIINGIAVHGAPRGRRAGLLSFRRFLHVIEPEPLVQRDRCALTRFREIPIGFIARKNQPHFIRIDAFDTNGDSQLTADEAVEPLSSYVGLGTDDAITAMVECAFLVADEDGT